MTTETQAKRTEGEAVIKNFDDAQILVLSGGKMVANCTGVNRIANAEYIRKAWNMHEELVAMVVELRGFACLSHEKPLEGAAAITRANKLLAKAQ